LRLAGRASIAAGVLHRLGCPTKPVNFADGQVAELRDAVGLDALGKDPPQGVLPAFLCHRPSTSR
jgi:hypothetical protein